MSRKKSCKWLITLLLVFVLIAGFGSYKVLYKYRTQINALKKEISSVRGLPGNTFGVILKDDENLILVDKDDNAVSRFLTEGKKWEPHIIKFLNKAVHPGDKIVSVGSHIGYHILQMSKLVGEQGMIYCFEPNPKTMKFLTLNLILNGVNNVKLFEKAAYSENTVLEFAAYNNPDTPSGGSHITPKDNKHYHESLMPGKAIAMQVEAVTLDSALNDVKEINILQMDIEGAEPYVILGAKELIKRSPSLLIVQEWWIEAMKSYPELNIQEYIKFWRDLGYKFARISEDKLQEMTDQELLAIPDLIDIVIAKDLEPLQKAYSLN